MFHRINDTDRSHLNMLQLITLACRNLCWLKTTFRSIEKLSQNFESIIGRMFLMQQHRRQLTSAGTMGIGENVSQQHINEH